MGRFISPDTIIPDPANPQSFNRYSYCLNNPLKYVDPSGYDVFIGGVNVEDIDAALNSGAYMRLLAIARTIADDHNSLIAYGEFREVYSDEAEILENSSIQYDIYSDTTQIEDLHITCSMQLQDQPFTLTAPPGSGQASFSIFADWNKGRVTIDVSASVRIMHPETSSGFGSAELRIGNTQTRISMDYQIFQGPIWDTPNTSHKKGTIYLYNGFPESRMSVDLVVSAETKSSDPSALGYHINFDSWSVTLWEGM